MSALLALALAAASSTPAREANHYVCQGTWGDKTVTAILDTSGVDGRPHLAVSGGGYASPLGIPEVKTTAAGWEATSAVPAYVDGTQHVTLLVGQAYLTDDHPQIQLPGMLVRTTEGEPRQEPLPGPVQANDFLSVSCKAEAVWF